MAVKGSFFQAYGNLVAEAIETAQEASYEELMGKVEGLVIKELNSLFPRIVNRMARQRLSFNNAWIGSYTPPPLDPYYQAEKERSFGAKGADYFKGRNSLSKGKARLATRGKHKGKPLYNHHNSLYFKMKQLASDPRVGELIYKNSGGLGSKTKVVSGLDPSKGAIVDGKPKKYGQRGRLINARWQDIVSDEFVRLGKLKGSIPINGYRKSSNPNYVIRPDGKPILLTRAIAQGNIIINLQGSFFRNIKEHHQGMLNFLIKHTSLLELRTADIGVSKYRVQGVLLDLAENNRLLIDPVFGEVLKDIRKKLDKLIKEVSSRG